jgi:hypothetical protein
MGFHNKKAYLIVRTIEHYLIGVPKKDVCRFESSQIVQQIDIKSIKNFKFSKKSKTIYYELLYYFGHS